MECGVCSLCCTLCAVEDLNKAAGTMCEHCDETCTIYEDRPKGCRDFSCAYAQMEQVNMALRPDKCGVVFEKINSTSVLGMVDPSRDEYPYTQKQIELFKQAGFDVVMTIYGKVTWQ